MRRASYACSVVMLLVVAGNARGQSALGSSPAEVMAQRDAALDLLREPVMKPSSAGSIEAIHPVCGELGVAPDAASAPEGDPCIKRSRISTLDGILCHTTSACRVTDGTVTGAF